MKSYIPGISIILIFLSSANAQNKMEKDVFDTQAGKLSITFIGHGSLMIDMNGKVIYLDPVSMAGDYSKMPKADIILITHHHPDHLDAKTISLLTKKDTKIVLTKDAYDLLGKGMVIKNGETKTVEGISIEAVPAYNTTEGRDIYHPKGRDNGYVLTLGKKRVYVAGDTEDIPEMSKLKNIDIAFLPVNQPYTMTPEQLESAALKFSPKILYPYHTGDTDISKVKALMAKHPAIETRIRSMK